MSDDWDRELAVIERYEIASYVLYGLAAAGVTGGLVWLLVDTEPSESADVPALSLSPTPGGAYGHATWRF